ncbi:OadG-related small transporter subunit [Peptoniphilus stercorisuis]|uniref:Na+-transporting methylmalonyl-CoA/oxaloacetate decarboxylase gamma subunit n=1 Tax=Peptoniphilus stercorisuis TaxID=1436965 RepID=A0ABS4KBM3_9FIRM|nr:OadG-related small transporter subunit [Peptoniphilus stercorisuis]MBP2025157.1 Na+-transporting methylmalonyl-CoA/oxaloacetate decarboxylase gamma subunit [Peptoniphilus stercorisuis]
MKAELLQQGVEVSIFGLAGVFAVLILFYISIKLLMLLFRNHK